MEPQRLLVPSAATGFTLVAPDWRADAAVLGLLALTLAWIRFGKTRLAG